MRARLHLRAPRFRRTGMPFVDSHLLPSDVHQHGEHGQRGSDQADSTLGGLLASSGASAPSDVEVYRLPIIEIVSLRPGSGKTRLLDRVASEALGARDAGGLVVWIDADGHFEYERFRAALAAVVAEQPGARAADTEVTVTARLQCLHLFQPQSSSAVVAILEGLEGYLLDDSLHFSMAFPLRAIIISGLSAFLWQDRREDLDSDPEHLPPGVATTHVLADRWRAIVTRLKELQKNFGCLIVTSDITHSPPMPGPRIQSQLPTVWNKFVTLRVLVARDPDPKYPPALSIDRALEAYHLQEEGEGVQGFTVWKEEEGVRIAPAGRAEPTLCFRFRIANNVIQVIE